MQPSEIDLQKLNRSRRIIYLLVALAILVPYFLVLPLPFKASPLAKKLYDHVDALKPGTRVLVALDYDPAAVAELNPMAQAILRHCFKKGLVPVVMTHWSTGIDMAERITREAAVDAGKRYGREFESGRDWVYLGFRTGGYAVVMGMGKGLKGVFEKDFYGKPTQGMAALEGIASLKDIGLAVDLAAGATVGLWIAYGSDRYGFPLGVGTTAVQAPDMYPFLSSGQLVGLLAGLRGAADYENLLDVSGDATRGMLAQSAAHVLMIGLIVFANVRFLAGRFGRKRKD
jgi:hypothetical protein